MIASSKPTPTTGPPAGDGQISPIAVDARGVVERVFPGCFALRTWRTRDAQGAVPAGFRVGGRRLWRVRDLELWARWGFPARPEFQRRLAELDGKT